MPMTHQTAAALRALEQKWRQLVNVVGGMGAGVYVRCADELAAVLTQEGADESKELKQALDLGDQLADWCNLAGPALKGIMDAYERRIRTDCTPEQLEKRPWECSEWLQARDALDKKPVAELVLTVAAPAEGAGTDEDAPPRGMEGRNWYAEYRVAQEHAEQIDDLCVANARALFRALHPGEPYDEIEREQSHDITCEAVNRILQPTAAAAVPAGGDAVPVAYIFSGYSIPHRCALWPPTTEEIEATRDGSDATIQPLYTAPAPRGGVTEALEETQSTSRPFCPSCQESLLRIVDNAQPPSELQRELAGAQDTIKHALEHMDNGYPNAAHDALSYYLKRIRETPAAQAQDAGVKSNNAAIREHLRDDDRGSDAWWDRVHEKARALAAKEAK